MSEKTIYYVKLKGFYVSNYLIGEQIESIRLSSSQNDLIEMKDYNNAIAIAKSLNGIVVRVKETTTVKTDVVTIRNYGVEK